MDLVPESSTADAHPRLSASQNFQWERKRSSSDGEVMAGLPHMKCGYGGVVPMQR